MRVRDLRDRPLGALIRLREPKGQHTEAEALALARYSTGARNVVEIGVAEGVSASLMRQTMDPTGSLWLVDPYLSRYPISPARMVAKRTVRRLGRAAVIWVRQFSYDAAKTWNQPIDLLFIDGDHQEQACERDWLDWSGQVRQGGVVAFHDSALGPGSPAREDWGPVRVVDRRFRQPDSKEPGWTLVETVDSITFVRCELTNSSGVAGM